MYEWIDPWEEIEIARNMQERWHEREDYFYRDMRMAQNAAFENSLEIRRAYDNLLHKVADTIPVTLPPLTIRASDLK